MPKKPSKAPVNLSKARKESREPAAERVKEHKKKGKFPTSDRLLSAQLQAIGLRLKTIPGDGNCLFRAVADQLTGSENSYEEIRKAACEELASDKLFFTPFIGSDDDFSRYLANMRKGGTWGSQLELVAISRHFRCNLVVHQKETPRFILYSPEFLKRFPHNDPGKIFAEIDSFPTIHLAFHESAEHYSSVRLLEDPASGGMPMKITMKSILQHEKSPNPPGRSDSSLSLTLQEKIIIESTGHENLEEIRILLSDLGDLDAVIEILIAEREIKKNQTVENSSSTDSFNHPAIEEKKEIPPLEGNSGTPPAPEEKSTENPRPSENVEIVESLKISDENSSASPLPVAAASKPPKPPTLTAKDRRRAARNEKEEKIRQKEQRKKEKRAAGAQKDSPLIAPLVKGMGDLIV